MFQCYLLLSLAKTLLKNWHMKSIISLLLTLACTLVFAGNLQAQTAPEGKKVTVTYQWVRIPGPGSNQVAIWVEDVRGSYVRTLFATRYTAQGGYVRRPVSLSEWVQKSDWKNAPKEEVDAVSGSTPAAGLQTVTWDGRDRTGKVMPAGTYVIRMEANILNEKKMFFRGEISVGGGNQKTNGNITYSEPGLESGNVLFRDVVVEYK